MPTDNSGHSFMHNKLVCCRQNCCLFEHNSLTQDLHWSCCSYERMSVFKIQRAVKTDGSSAGNDTEREQLVVLANLQYDYGPPVWYSHEKAKCDSKYIKPGIYRRVREVFHYCAGETHLKYCVQSQVVGKMDSGKEFDC